MTGELLTPKSAARTHAPELEQHAYNQRPKTAEWAETKLYRYDGTDLYQWFGRPAVGIQRTPSVFWEACDEPFVISRRPQEVGDRELSEEKSEADAPVWYSDIEADAWASGYNAAISTRAPSVGERQPPDARVEVLLAAYKGGYKDGYVDARYSEDEEQLLREIDNVAVLEGFDALRDALLALSAPVSEPSVGVDEIRRALLAGYRCAGEDANRTKPVGWERLWEEHLQVHPALSQPRPEGEMREGSEHGALLERAKADSRYAPGTLIYQLANTIEALVRERDEARAYIETLDKGWDEIACRYRDERDALRTQLDRANYLLEELHAVVQGECPSLLNEDSGGDAKLALDLDAYFASLSPVDGGSVTPLAAPSVVSPSDGTGACDAQTGGASEDEGLS